MYNNILLIDAELKLVFSSDYYVRNKRNLQFRYLD